MPPLKGTPSGKAGWFWALGSGCTHASIRADQIVGAVDLTNDDR
jgi:hypothetical protein